MPGMYEATTTTSRASRRLVEKDRIIDGSQTRAAT